jgi:hypothetical protein
VVKQSSLVDEGVLTNEIFVESSAREDAKKSIKKSSEEVHERNEQVPSSSKKKKKKQNRCICSILLRGRPVGHVGAMVGSRSNS